MRRIPQPIIDQVLDRTDIVDVVSNYVNLKRRGQNFFGICPFHKEKTGSFSVHPERQIFKCFGCGKAGSAITFVQAVENLMFGEAVRFLADKAGVRIEVEDGGRRDTRVRPEIDRMQVLEQVTTLFAKWLEGSNEARDYLARRGIDQATAQRFRLGYAQDSWDALQQRLSRSNIPPAVQEELGLIISRKDGQGHYDRFRKRIIFPIANPLGKVVAFGGRILGDGEPKYLNSPETPLFNKSRTLYLLEKAREAIRREGKTLVVEGYMDAIALHRFGYDYSVATLGTALTENHARLLRRYGENIFLIYDGDEAGLLAAQRGVEVFLSIGLPVRVVLLPPGEDPDSLLGKEGQEAMDAVLEEACDGFKFCVDRVVAVHGVDSAVGKRGVVRALLPVLKRIPEATVRAQYVTVLTSLIGVQPDDEKGILRDLEQLLRRHPSTDREGPGPAEVAFQLRTEDLDAAERAKLHIVVVLLNALGLARTEEGEEPHPELGCPSLRPDERERISQVVDLIPDREEYPLSAVIKKLLSIKPRTYRNMASLLEGAFVDDPRPQTIVTVAPDLVPITGDRDRILFDAAHILEEQRKKRDHRSLASSLRQQQSKEASPSDFELLRKIDALHGLGKRGDSA